MIDKEFADIRKFQAWGRWNYSILKCNFHAQLLQCTIYYTGTLVEHNCRILGKKKWPRGAASLPRAAPNMCWWPTPSQHCDRWWEVLQPIYKTHFASTGDKQTRGVYGTEQDRL